jgi:hypothetical protein
MMRYARQTERPDDFQVDLGADIFRSLKFANFGRARGSLKYVNECDPTNPGALTGFTGAGNTPVDRWGRAMGRANLTYNGSSDYSLVPVAGLALPVFTLSAWIKTATFTAGHAAWGCNKFSDGTGGFIFHYPTGTGTNVRFYIWNGSTLKYKEVAGVSGAWTHWAMTFNGDTIEVFQNGVSLGTTPSIGAISYTGVSGYAVGRYYYNDPNTIFGGSSCDNTQWSRALSPAEIARLADPQWSVMMGGAIYTRPNRSLVGQVGGGAPTPMSSYYYQLLAGAA